MLNIVIVMITRVTTRLATNLITRLGTRLTTVMATILSVSNASISTTISATKAVVVIVDVAIVILSGGRVGKMVAVDNAGLVLYRQQSALHHGVLAAIYVVVAGQHGPLAIVLLVLMDRVTVAVIALDVVDVAVSAKTMNVAITVISMDVDHAIVAHTVIDHTIVDHTIVDHTTVDHTIVVARTVAITIAKIATRIGK
ncbi:hypothetical protein F5Y18DRAFT_411809 [Xylariaceae sp. FL1019]|nr:hypothetical protein F5Y18DRAFT_411809 [Xylariaceae sp. FL1019]